MLRSLVLKQLCTNLGKDLVRQPCSGATLSSARCWTSDSHQAAQQHLKQPVCRFASAYSDQPTLARAVTECVAQVKNQLGPETRLDLCQLLVTLGHGEHLRLAPMVTHSRFKSPLHVLLNCYIKISNHTGTSIIH